MKALLRSLCAFALVVMVGCKDDASQTAAVNAEPLPAGHRLWTHPRVIVTPHTAGGSPRRAQRVIATFCENLRRLRTGEPLLALIDKDKGY